MSADRGDLIVIDDPHSVAALLMADAGLVVLSQARGQIAHCLDVDRFAPLDLIGCEDRATPVPFRPHWPIAPRPAFIVEPPPSKRARRRARGKARR